MSAPRDSRLLGLSTADRGSGVTVLRVSGEIDTATVGRFADAVRASVGGAPTLVLDLSAVGYLGSRGLHCLAAAHRCATDLGTRLVVEPGRANRAVWRPLEVSGLDAVLEVGHAPYPAPRDGDGRPAVGNGSRRVPRTTV
ncbi:STAS domain-containing protein [Pseudonocardia xishanensis]|uniref:STAS domain-containing protein n=1 Tax=Pseudonocardia xishanensis TaxID=630995 RepID=A0ABP8RLI7_9PSEU